MNVPDSEGVTLLMRVALSYYSNKAPMATFLLSNGANINAADQVGRTALYYAVRADDASLVQALAATTDWNAHDNYKVSILSYAVWSNNLAMVNYILSKGANVNYPDSMGGGTPLQAAAGSPNAAIRAAFGLP